MANRLADLAPALEAILTRADAGSPSHADSSIRRETVFVSMRDGVRLATDLYLPAALPAPAVAFRTPYGRKSEASMPTILALARRGYVVIAQDCRGTGESEPDTWDYYVYEPEDGVDLVEWVTQQAWFDGWLSAFGGSYSAATQWCMSAHPRMSAIMPEMGSLRTIRNTVRPYMFVNGYVRTVGKGENRIDAPLSEIERLIEPETMAGGYFNEPLVTPIHEALLERYPELRRLSVPDAKRQLWARFCSLPPAERTQLLKQLMGVSEFSYVEMSALPTVFDCLITYGVHTIPSADAAALCQRLHAPALILTGWYDWNLVDILPSWSLLRRTARAETASRCRLIITPSAHHAPGYHEGAADHPELRCNHRYNVDLMLSWYAAVRDDTLDRWPTVIYYLMGANEWRSASDWPVPEAKPTALYLGPEGLLTARAPSMTSSHDSFIYDPAAPTPTVGGSILSYLYPPGSVDVSEVQKRADVLTYTSAVLKCDLDVVGPLRLILYASSSALDTDFAARVSDVFPDGRAIQLQSGVLRARYRHLEGDPSLLEPGRIHEFEIDLWAAANRFKAGHRLRLDISSADFPRFDRNSNRGGEPGEPIEATQTVYHDATHPSRLLLSILGDNALSEESDAN